MHIYAHGFAAYIKKSHKRVTFDTFDQPAQAFFSDPAAVKSTFAEARAQLDMLYQHRILFLIPGGNHDTKLNTN